MIDFNEKYIRSCKTQLVFNQINRLGWGTSSSGNLGSLHIFEDVINIAKPKNILEIGFHTGRSAMSLLEYSDKACLTSCDVGEPWVSINEIIKSVNIINEIRERCEVFIGSSLTVKFRNFAANEKYDLMYVDGRHEEFLPRYDLETGILLGIPYILLDDYVPKCKTNGVYYAVRYFEDKQAIEVIKKYPYEVIRDNRKIADNTMILVKNISANYE